MAELKDSGTRRQFESGAVRDIAEGKGRCDLLPLDIVGIILDDRILSLINKYIRSGDAGCLNVAILTFVSYHTEWERNLYTAILEVAKQYEDGARKYNDRNWEKGIPLHCFIDSAIRHYLKYKRGDDDEPHDRAFVWNLLGAMWTHTHRPELIDLPFKEEMESEE